MKAVFALLLLVLLVLQYDLWIGDGGMRSVWRLDKTLSIQRADNARLAERNQALEAEVHDLKQGLAAIEECARSELGMIKPGETYYQIVEEHH